MSHVHSLLLTQSFLQLGLKWMRENKKQTRQFQNINILITCFHYCQYCHHTPSSDNSNLQYLIYQFT